MNAKKTVGLWRTPDRLCLMALVLTALFVQLTRWDHPRPAIILRERLAVGFTLLLAWAVSLVFKAHALKLFLWLGELAKLSDDEYRRKAAHWVAALGRFALFLGGAIVLVSIALYATGHRFL